ncbi:MAG: cobalamin transport system substrate-binding protein [Acidobacteriota bacterium]|nr:cobalamin transport system substrate-binding protein [Acidobacteriota bacterium]
MSRRIVILLIAVLAFCECGGERSARRVATAASTKRVVSLAPSVTEIVYALGAGRSLVATDDYSDFPLAAKQLPKVGGVQPNLEKIVALKPDLVISTIIGSSPNLAKALSAASIPLVSVRHDRVADIRVAITRIGSALGVADTARIADDVERRLAAQQRTRKHIPRVLIAVWTDPIFVGGRDTFADDLLQLTGAENAVPPSVSGWPQYSLESFVASPPDILIYPDHSVTRAQIDALLERTGAKCEAIAIDENRFTRLGPRTPEAAALLNEIFDRWERSH